MLSTAANVRKSAAAGISSRTAYRRRARDPDFAERWDDAIADALAQLEARVFDAALDGDMQTARWLLARRLPGLYGRHVELEQQGEVRAKRDVRIRFVTATKGRKDPDD